MIEKFKIEKKMFVLVYKYLTTSVGVKYILKMNIFGEI
jgi:hypothetical protein